MFDDVLGGDDIFRDLQGLACAKASHLILPPVISDVHLSAPCLSDLCPFRKDVIKITTSAR